VAAPVAKITTITDATIGLFNAPPSTFVVS